MSYTQMFKATEFTDQHPFQRAVECAPSLLDQHGSLLPSFLIPNGLFPEQLHAGRQLECAACPEGITLTTVH